MSDQDIKHKIMWEGDWRHLKPGVCAGDGKLEVWDQTVGCPECGMNLWYLPGSGRWPEWDKENEPPEDHWEKMRASGGNPYDAFARLFDMLHPKGFGDEP